MRKERLNAIESDIQRIKGSIFKSPLLKNFLLDSSQPRVQKCNAILSMLSENSYDEVTRNFFRVIAENGRLPITMKIIDGFETILRAYRSEVPIIITSAQMLTKELLEKLKQVIASRFLTPGQVARISSRVDPKIMGGIVVDIGDKTVDLSAATRVRMINSALLDAN